MKRGCCIILCTACTVIIARLPSLQEVMTSTCPIVICDEVERCEEVEILIDWQHIFTLSAILLVNTYGISQSVHHTHPCHNIASSFVYCSKLRRFLTF